MRIPTFLPATAFMLLSGLTPASAQLSGGVGSSNSTNQSFQIQNQMRGIQQQQTVQGNEMRMQNQRNQLYDGSRVNDGGVRRRR